MENKSLKAAWYWTLDQLRVKKKTVTVNFHENSVAISTTISKFQVLTSTFMSFYLTYSSSWIRAFQKQDEKYCKIWGENEHFFQFFFCNFCNIWNKCLVFLFDWWNSPFSTHSNQKSPPPVMITSVSFFHFWCDKNELVGLIAILHE